MLVATTSEIIKKLQEYEEKYGVGAVVSIRSDIRKNREYNYYFTIINDSYWNSQNKNEDKHFCCEEVDIVAVNDDEIFPRK